MEDAHCAITQLPGNLKDWSFFAVFDGHAGALISEQCASKLLKYIVNTDEFKKVDPELAPSLSELEKGIREGFLELDERLRKLPQVVSGEDKSGSTAICVLITPEHIFFANCGDSRAMLVRGNEVAFATTDHKPVHPTEKQRIQDAGGSVIVQRVNGSLAVSRSLGDYAFKADRDLAATEQLISPEPEVTVVDRNKDEDQILVLACDGIWDVMKNDDLWSLVDERMQRIDDLSKVCNEVIDHCLYKGSSDNMSVVLVAFDPAPTVNQKLQAEDELLEALIIERTQEFLKDKPYDANLQIDFIFSYLKAHDDISFPDNLLSCKGGVIHRLLDLHKASTSSNVDRPDLLRSGDSKRVVSTLEVTNKKCSANKGKGSLIHRLLDLHKASASSSVDKPEPLRSGDSKPVICTLEATDERCNVGNGKKS